MADVRPCGIADALELIGERWTLLVVRELFWENHRFASIAARTGASRDMLSARLKRLNEAGLVERRPYSSHPPRSEYHLTARGRALLPVLMAIDEWAAANLPGDSSGPERMKLPHHDHQLDPVSHFKCRICGETVPSSTVPAHADGADAV
jgi:DNA-binding HxlR family transcriptional regulator